MRRLLLSFLCLGMVAALSPARAQEVLEGVAAVVNQDVITFSQVREVSGPAQKQARETLKGADLVDKIKGLRAEAVSELVDRTLILQSAKTQGVTIPESAIDERIQSIIDKQYGGDRANFLKDLARLGYTLAKFREHVQEDLTVEKMRAAETSNASTPEEARQQEQKWLRGLHQKAYIKIY